MKFYFNANNKTQVSALRRAGVKNVMLTYKFVEGRAKDYANTFDDAMIGPGFGSDKGKYHDMISDWEHQALQYDEPNDGLVNYNNWKEGSEYNDRLIPILHQNYLQALSLFKPNYEGDRYALGKMASRSREDSELRKLPQNYSYHGLAKGRWLSRDKFGMIDSVDSSTWTSGVRGRKTDVWRGQSISFGDKGRNNVSYIQLACQKNLIYLSKLGLDPKDIISGTKGALTVAPLALYYMPMFKDLGCYDENFSI
jgi:hypothetical protein